MGEELATSLAVIAFVALVFGIVAVVATMRLRAARIHADTVGKLIEKLGATPEAMAYLESEAGQKLLDSVTSRRRNPYSRILLSLSVGSVLC